MIYFKSYQEAVEYRDKHYKGYIIRWSNERHMYYVSHPSEV